MVWILPDGNTRGAGDIFYESPSQYVHGQMVWRNYNKTQKDGQIELVFCVFESMCLGNIRDYTIWWTTFGWSHDEHGEPGGDSASHSFSMRSSKLLGKQHKGKCSIKGIVI